MSAQRFIPVFFCVLALGVPAQQQRDQLAGNTVLVIRHAEKPTTGAMLNHQGDLRAQQYTRYFEPFREEGMTFNVDTLYAGADSDNSSRPRLTLEPLSKAMNLPIDASVGTKEPVKLVAELRSQKHGRHPLIAWRHGQMPQMLQAFGAAPDKLLPDGKWPDDVFDWVIVLTFDDDGKLIGQQRIEEHLSLPQN